MEYQGKNICSPSSCPGSTTKIGNKCECPVGGYQFFRIQENIDQGVDALCKCPGDSPKPQSGDCPPVVTCEDGTTADSGMCCPDGKKMPVNGTCCPDGSAVSSSDDCKGIVVGGNPPVVDLAFPRTFNMHGDLSVRSIYSIGRADRPDYICYAYKIEQGQEQRESRIRQPSAYCPVRNKCNLDDKNRCRCKTLKNGEYVDITSRNNGVSIGEDSRYNGKNTYCVYASMDPFRISGSTTKVKSDSSEEVISREFQIVTTTTIPYSPPH